MQYVFELLTGRSPKEGWDEYESRKDRFSEKVVDAFAKYQPAFRGQGVSFRTDDYRLGFALIDWANKHEGESQPIAVFEHSIWDLRSLFHARYVPWLTTGEYLDLYPSNHLLEPGKPLNRYPKTLCKECGWFDETVVEQPYKVWGPLLRPKQETFYGLHGRFFVSERVLKLLTTAVGAQIQWGPVEIVGKPPKDAERKLFWVRPGHQTGRREQEAFEKTCPRCGVPIRCWTGPARPSFGQNRIVLERFGHKDWKIAVVGSWIGGRETPAQGYAVLRKTLLCGGLLAYLLANDVKGLLLPDAGVFSTDPSEPPFEEKRRLSDLLPDDAFEALLRKLAKRKRATL